LLILLILLILLTPLPLKNPRLNPHLLLISLPSFVTYLLPLLPFSDSKQENNLLSLNSYTSLMSREHRETVSIKTAVITVSTTRTEKTDLSGKIITEAFEQAGIPIVSAVIVKDDISDIRSAVLSALDQANCIVVNGGTGLTHDDCTIEAVSPLFIKTMDGFGELFRQKSYAQVGNAVILSRAAAGINKGRVIFCIPGSPKAVKLATEEIIIPEITHILTHANQ
ncbi:MAG: MogA/MoaB family molybdenum cofactor biosynthesis protein, partial [Methanocorpusculum sp.]|nr:MogA/MoaB family molybdenum cofactor biosynthesis protein [Methanocorpusculum sp.]